MRTHRHRGRSPGTGCRTPTVPRSVFPPSSATALSKLVHLRPPSPA